MIPPCSCATPGRKPGTSSNVTSGMLNASQNRMNRAPLSEALISSTPASAAGWFATTPTGRPPRRAKPTSRFPAKSPCTSRSSPSSTTRRITSRMSYALVGSSGTTSSSSSSRRSAGSALGRIGGAFRVFDRDEGGRPRGAAGVAAERRDALLNARATRVVEADHGRAVLERQVHHLADLLGVRLGQRATEDGEVL